MPGGIVVADTGPLHYLVLIGCADVLPRLFGSIAVPAAVAGELSHPKAPVAVRTWASNPSPWLAVHDDPAEPAGLRRLDPGERAAIALALALGAGLLLIDDRAGVAAARARASGSPVRSACCSLPRDGGCLTWPRRSLRYGPRTSVTRSLCSMR